MSGESGRRTHRLAIETAIAAWLGALLAGWFEVGPVMFGAIAPILVINADRQAGLSAGLLAIPGMSLGAWLGFEVAVFLREETIPMAAAIFVCGMLGTGGRFAGGRLCQFWMFMAVGALSILYLSIQTVDGLYVAARDTGMVLTLGVLAGVIVSVVSDRLWGPLPTPLAPPPAESGTLPPAQADTTAVGLVAGIMAVLIPVLWALYALPNLSEIAITSFVLIDRDIATMRMKAGQRILGCFAGGCAGLAVVGLGADSFLQWSAMLMAGMYYFSRVMHGQPRWSYLGMQGIFAFTACLLTGFGPPDTVVPAINRFVGILVALFLMAIVVRLVRPLVWREDGPEPDRATMR